MPSSAALLSEFIQLIPEIDDRELSREGERAGKRAATSIAGELLAGIREGMAEGAQKATPQFVAEAGKGGARAGTRLGQELGEQTQRSIENVLTASAGEKSSRRFTQGMERGLGGDRLTSGIVKEMDTKLPAAGDRAGERTGSRLRSRMKSMSTSIVAPLVAGFAAIGVKDFLSDAISGARESQKIGAQTEQVIKSTGSAAKVSADQVGDLATAISNKTGYDDEAIQSGQNLLLTFTNVRNEAGKGNDIFSQTTSLMTDMSVALGQDTKASAIQLGKALNDPIKGVTALSKVGVSFTAQQKDQIKALVKSGDTMGAQKIILAELNKEFGGSAAAQSTATDKLKTSFGNLQEQLGGVLLPVVDKLATWMTTKTLPAVSSFLDEMQNGSGKGGAFARFLSDTGAKAQQLGTWFMATAVPAIRQFIAEFKAGEGSGGAFKKTLQTISDAVGKLIGFLTGHPDLVKTFVAGFGGLLAAKKSVDGLSSAFSSVKSKIDTAKAGWDAGKSALGGLKTAASSTSGAFSQLKAGLSGAKPPTATAWSAAGNSMRNAGIAAKGYATSALASSRAAITSAASTARAGAASALAAAKTGIMTAATKGMAVAQRALNAVMRMNPIGLVVTALVALGAGLVVAYKKSETFRNIVDGAWRVVKSAFKGTIDWITGTAWPAFNKVLGWMGSVVSGAKDVIVKAWSKITGAFSAAYSWVTGFFKKHWATILTVLTGPIGLAVSQIIKHRDKITDALSAAKDWAVGTFKRAWSAVKSVLTDPVGAAKRALDTLLGASGLRRPFTAVKDWAVGTFKRAWAAVKGVFTDPVGAAKRALDTLLGASGLRRPFTAVKDWAVGTFKRAWNGLKKIFTDPVDAAKTAISRILGASGLQKVVSGARDAIGRIWDGLKKKLATPLNATIGLINDPFVRGFNNLLSKVPGLSWRIPTIPRIAMATGGVLPGYTPGRDVHRFVSPTGGLLDLSGGEAIMRPEFTAALGKPLIDRFNAAARAGGISGVQRLMAGDRHEFATGGIFPHRAFAGGGVWDKVKDGVSAGYHKVKDVASSALDFVNPASWVKSAANALMGGFGNGFAAQIAKGALSKVVGGTIDAIKSLFAGGGPGGGPVGGGGPGQPGAGWRWQWATVKKAFPSATLNSSVRPGARTAGYGSVSYHALGRAIDIGGPQMSQIANWLVANYGKKSHDIIYSPNWGSRAIVGGRWGSVNAVTQRNHYDHVHWGFNKGGVMPKFPVFDQGGTLAPGLNVVDNRLGRAEPLVRPDQHDSGDTFHIETVELRMEDLKELKTLEDFMALIEMKTRQRVRKGK